MPATVERYGSCSRCAIKSRKYEFDRIAAALRNPSWYRVQHTKRSKEAIIREYLDSLDDLAPTELEFDDTPAGRRWKALAGSGRGKRPR